MNDHVLDAHAETLEPEIDRRDTGIRIALTLLFAIIHGVVVDTVLGVIIVFNLLWCLITRQPPSARLRELANRIVTFDYRIQRYLTYNEATLPFPFSDFPEPLEPPTWSPSLRESDALGLSPSDAEDWDDDDPGEAR